VDLILLDWTRMGHIYCLAGAVVESGQYRIVRPLPDRGRKALPNQGWSPYLLDGRHSRWEVFELVRPVPAHATPPHVEDWWVKDLKSRHRFASRDERRAILQATLAAPGQPIFGAALERGHAGTYLEPGRGERSLTSVVVHSAEVHFTTRWRDGCDQPDYCVRLPVPDLDERILPVTDHFLLCRAERCYTSDIDARARFLDDAVRLMGHQVLVRLGLSRSFPAAAGQPGRCWLMADGFFSLDDPQA
jgi:hypothetical protein